MSDYQAIHMPQTRTVAVKDMTPDDFERFLSCEHNSGYGVAVAIVTYCIMYPEAARDWLRDYDRLSFGIPIDDET